jgi:hypothetical protein
MTDLYLIGIRAINSATCQTSYFLAKVNYDILFVKGIINEQEQNLYTNGALNHCILTQFCEKHRYQHDGSTDCSFTNRSSKS